MASPRPANLWRRQVRNLRTPACRSKSTCFPPVQQDTRCLACLIGSVFYVYCPYHRVRTNHSAVFDDHPSCLPTVRDPTSRCRTFHTPTRGPLSYRLIHSARCWHGVSGNCEVRVLSQSPVSRSLSRRLLYKSGQYWHLYQ